MNLICNTCCIEWIPQDDDIKTNGDYYKLCKKCREYTKLYNAKTKQCIEEDCITRRSFNYPNEKSAKYCSIHAKDGMIDILKRKCPIENCKITPGFNFPNEKKGLFCKIHAEKGMIDISHVKCAFDDCYKTPIFNFPNEKKGLFCKNHSKEGMIDIKSSRCIEEKCNITASFNFPNETKKLFCKLHSKEGMIDISHQKCVFENCYLTPLFNYPNEKKGLYCSIHSKEGMIDVKHTKCIEEYCDKLNKIDKYCIRCFYAKFPNDNRCKRIKIKENEIVRFIHENFKDLSIIYDEQLKGDGLCFNIRPDIMIHLNTHSIIIECDEYQHRSYDIQCDITRTHKIQEALNRPILMIRFNPDEYIDFNKNEISSCFKIDKKIGLTIIPKEQEKLWKERLEKLKNTIIENLDIKLEEPIKIIKLFYDEI